MLTESFISHIDSSITSVCGASAHRSCAFWAIPWGAKSSNFWCGKPEKGAFPTWMQVWGFTYTSSSIKMEGRHILRYCGDGQEPASYSLDVRWMSRLMQQTALNDFAIESVTITTTSPCTNMGQYFVSFSIPNAPAAICFLLRDHFQHINSLLIISKCFWQESHAHRSFSRIKHRLSSVTTAKIK